MVSWVFTPPTMDDFTGSKQFNHILKESVGNTLVIVHGHSSDLSAMGEQNQDELKNEEGEVIQKKGNRVSMNDILSRYNDAKKYSAIVLNGCNHKGGVVEAKNVPVFYPIGYVQYDTGRQGAIGKRYKVGLALPQEPTS